MKSLIAGTGLVLWISAGLAGAWAEDRKVLAELFTSTTCSPCYNADQFYFVSWLPGFVNREKVITITYHVWWPSPGTDPMYHANTAPVRARASYYQGSSLYVPRMYINGYRDGTHVYSGWPTIIADELAVVSPLRVLLSGVRDSTSMKVEISVTATAQVNSTNWRLHCAVVEDSISEPQASSSGYVPFTHEWVHRDMIPNAEGTALSIQQGGTVSVERQIAIRPGWKAENCKVVAFVQDMLTKEVQQAEVLEVSAMTWETVSVSEGPLPELFILRQNYPNPFNSSTRIRYSIPREMPVTLTVVDALGRTIEPLVNRKQSPGFHEVVFDASPLTSGVYFYRLEAGGFRETKRMILVK